MNFGRSFFDYIHFVRKYAQFSKLFYLSQSLLAKEYILSDKAINALGMLNDSRISIFKRISELNLELSVVCEKCCGECCLGFYEHFSSIDFWLRKLSPDPLENHGVEVLIPWYILLLQYRLGGLHIFRQSTFPQTGCPHLGKHCCNLVISNRPIRCVAFMCNKVTQTMNKDKKHLYAKKIKELYFISLNVFNILKEEVGIPKVYGKLSLLLTF